MSPESVKDESFVGPVVTAGEMADAIMEGMREDNPDREIIVQEHASYVRIWAKDECVIRIETISRMLGRTVSIGDIEMNMPSFAGFIETSQDRIRFYASL